MHPQSIATAILLLATSINAVPLEDTTTLLDRPDGGYTIQYNDEGTNTVLKFTPLADMNFTEVSSVVDRSLESRSSKSVCEGLILDRTNLIQAWQCLQNLVGGGLVFGKGQIGYCKVGSVVVYACNYATNTVTRDTIQNALSTVSLNCGDLTSGYQRCQSDCGLVDSTIGRKNNGGDFCYSGFTG
ncbi:hypothetical protein F5Y10DRAFT_266645 [Nemania abortiva]|nr:hypothetical protein F5Y10DRAFT_266645 [Nemania abortiva]